MIFFKQSISRTAVLLVLFMAFLTPACSLVSIGEDDGEDLRSWLLAYVLLENINNINCNFRGGDYMGSTCLPFRLPTTTSTVVGDQANSGTTDATGTSARLNNPRGITSDGTYLYICDTSNHRIRRFNPITQVVTTFAGSSMGSADGIGIAAQFNSPYGITSEGVNLFVSDSQNHTIRKIVISTQEV